MPSDPTARGRVLQVSLSPGGLPKLAVPGAHIGRLGLVGDQHRGDTVHGGPLRAVCVFGIEAIERLQAEGHPVEPGSVGENLTTAGIEWSTLPVGTRVRVGQTALLELTKPSMPCDKQRPNFAGGRINRISIALHPADSRMYARVLEEGHVRPGDEITLLPPAATSDAALIGPLDRIEGATAHGFLALWGAAIDAGHDVRILHDGELTIAASPELTSPLYNDAVSGMRTLPHLLPRVLDHFRAAGAAGLIESDEPPWSGAPESAARAVLAASPADVAAAAADVSSLAAPAGVAVRATHAEEWRLIMEVLVSDGEGPRTAATGALLEGVLPRLFATPGVSAFVAGDEGRPLGTGTLVVHRRVGSLVMGVVAPAARGRGIQRALIAARAAAAAEAGCDLLCAEAEADSVSERNFRRLGFERLRVARTWRFDPRSDPCPDLTERPVTAAP